MAAPESRVCAHCKQESRLPYGAYCRTCERLRGSDRRKGIRWRPPLSIDGKRRCSKCHQYLPLTRFYRNKAAPSGYNPCCKVCFRLSYPRAGLRRYTDAPEVFLKNSRLYQARHPERCRARKLAYRALKRGGLVRQPCERCGDPKSEMHHADYDQPLAVTWLCLACHRIEHWPLE